MINKKIASAMAPLCDLSDFFVIRLEMAKERVAQGTDGLRLRGHLKNTREVVRLQGSLDLDATVGTGGGQSGPAGGRHASEHTLAGDSVGEFAQGVVGGLRPLAQRFVYGCPQAVEVASGEGCKLLDWDGLASQV